MRKVNKSLPRRRQLHIYKEVTAGIEIMMEGAL